LKREIVTQPKMKLMGISIRTSNAAEFNPETAQIGATVQKYMAEGIYASITSQKKPGTTLCVYTDFESDRNGEFTYFIGAEVESTAQVPEGLATITIPTQSYVKFTTDEGVMPKVCIDGWLDIWNMSDEELGGEREYRADFEVYDHRAMNPASTALDIYIGIKK
jgi:predicted transcriptional regulator YdeE